MSLEVKNPWYWNCQLRVYYVNKFFRKSMSRKCPETQQRINMVINKIYPQDIEILHWFPAGTVLTYGEKVPH